MALAMGITILLFVFISSYSSIIAQEIASEKALESWKLFSLVQKRKPILWQINWGYSSSFNTNFHLRGGVCSRLFSIEKS